jgi:hypothetical protein
MKNVSITDTKKPHVMSPSEDNSKVTGTIIICKDILGLYCSASYIPLLVWIVQNNITLELQTA